MTKKEVILRHDARGFFLIDKETEDFITLVDVGSKEEEVDWELIEQQADEQGYLLVD